MAKLFVDTTVASALATARESIEVGVNEDGVTVVKFALARGKGTGAQEIPVSELPAFIEALNGYAVNGLNRTAKSLSCTDMLHATINMNDDDRISFRAANGKGAKPTNLAPGELPGVIGFLREVQPMVEAAAGKLKK
jgi:hypothetical protein